MRLVVQTNVVGAHHLWLVRPTGILTHAHHQHLHHGADKLLVEIDTLIGRRRIDDIVVVRGPGAFTAIRAALVVTNMLGWLRNIPVTGVVRKEALTQAEILKFASVKHKKFGSPVRPWYGKKPNITIAKKRR